MPINSKGIKIKFNKYVDDRVELLFKYLIKALHTAGLNAVKTSRTRHRYTDWTGNLTSSVGYVLVDNGNVVTQDFKNSEIGTDKQTGTETGQAFAQELASQYNSGLQLIIVAGMPYARYVEALGLDVLDSAEVQAKEEAIKNIKGVMQRWQH